MSLRDLMRGDGYGDRIYVGTDLGVGPDVTMLAIHREARTPPKTAAILTDQQRSGPGWAPNIYGRIRWTQECTCPWGRPHTPPCPLAAFEAQR